MEQPKQSTVSLDFVNFIWQKTHTYALKTPCVIALPFMYGVKYIIGLLKYPHVILLKGSLSCPLFQIGSADFSGWDNHCCALYQMSLPKHSCCRETSSRLINAVNPMTSINIVKRFSTWWPWPLNLTHIFFGLTYLPKIKTVRLSVQPAELHKHTHTHAHTHTYDVKTITPSADEGCKKTRIRFETPHVVSIQSLIPQSLPWQLLRWSPALSIIGNP